LSYISLVSLVFEINNNIDGFKGVAGY
jgi:hypothetical protein